ncbi:MAG TPA: hypothetical protein VK922_17660 [Gemmatimonadaceae bacterium]|nr:hypothetical protein [Gemmatimonadaceae bacterium]
MRDDRSLAAGLIGMGGRQSRVTALALLLSGALPLESRSVSRPPNAPAG